MINKFQQGGKQEQAMIQFVQAIAKVLKADPKQIVQIAQQNPNTIKVAAETFQQTQDINQAANAFAQEAQKSTQAARHGAKLNYVKSLKHQCADDEELVYYKRGGSVGCGCKKKENEGEVNKAKCGAVAKFKKMQKGKKITNVNPNDTVHVNGKVYSTTNSDGTPVDKRFPSYSGKVEQQDRKLAKSGNKDAKKRQEKQDLTSSEKKGGSIIKTFKDKCGSKLKKHQQGGSFKQAWNEARKNKVRYFNYNGKMYNSKAAGTDNEYNTFRDNMNEMSALLPTDNSPKHLGWERNNPISNELRGGDRQIKIQGTESTLPEITIIGNKRAPKSPAKTSVKSEVYYNVPLGRIEYVGRDGQRYWMARSDANGQWYYDKIENSANYGPKYHKAVPEGYIIPGTNTPITTGKNNNSVNEMILGLKKKWMKNGGSLNGIPFMQKGTFKGGINLNPPNNGVFNELKRNIKNGLEQGKKMFSSIPLNILLGGVGAGTTSVNLVNKGKQFANWLVKDPYNSGLDQISALGWIGSGPAVGVAMFDPFRWSKDAKREDELEKYGTSAEGDYIRRQEAFKKSWNLAK